MKRNLLLLFGLSGPWITEQVLGKALGAKFFEGFGLCSGALRILDFPSVLL